MRVYKQAQFQLLFVCLFFSVSGNNRNINNWKERLQTGSQDVCSVVFGTPDSSVWASRPGGRCGAVSAVSPAAPGPRTGAEAGLRQPPAERSPRGSSGRARPAPSPAEGAATPRLLPPAGGQYLSLFLVKGLSYLVKYRHSCIFHTVVAEDGLSKKTVQEKGSAFQQFKSFLCLSSQFFSPSSWELFSCSTSGPHWAEGVSSCHTGYEGHALSSSFYMYFLCHAQSLEPSTGISKTSSCNISTRREESKLLLLPGDSSSVDVFHTVSSPVLLWSLFHKYLRKSKQQTNSTCRTPWVHLYYFSTLGFLNMK